MVLIHCLDMRISCVKVCAQELAEFGNISLAEKGVKHVIAILGEFVKAFRTVLAFSLDILIGSDNAYGCHTFRPTATAKFLASAQSA